MKLFSLFLFLFFSSPTFLFSQNLVPNHSFEVVENLPLRGPKRNAFEFEHKSGYLSFQTNLKDWTAASDATPDLRIIPKAYLRECKKVYKDCNVAKTGAHVAGIMTYLHNTNTETFREYIQVKLKKTIKPGIKTYCELWIQKDRQAKLVSNNIGFYFSQKKFYEETEDNIEKQPQINHTEIINQENMEWVKIEGTFVPDKPLIHLTIGNFYNNENTNVESFKKYRGLSWTPAYTHYLIDDVRVWQEGDQPEDKLVFDISKIDESQPVVLKNIFFDFDQSSLKPASFEELNHLLVFLQKNKNIKIAIHGHTDNHGNDAYNLRLSSSRAHVVMDFLIKNGIEEKRLKSKGFGEDQPMATNDTEEGREKNRRVEFLILEKQFGY
jgi:outer membrane protein OmpA-like peptidoglycan-associated protein